MANENISVQQDTESTISPNSTSNIQLTETEDVTIRRFANHNEVAIMENDWRQIKRKINKLKIAKHLNIPNIVLGAIIPYTIDVICSFLNKQEPNYFPLIICIVILVISTMIAKIFPILGSDNSEENMVHLNDLKYLLNQVDIGDSK